MTTNNDKTRLYTNNDDTQFLPQTDDSTQMLNTPEAPEEHTDDITKPAPQAPKKSTAKTAAFAAGGVAVGAAMGAGISAMASGNSHGDSKLTQAADPDSTDTANTDSLAPEAPIDADPVVIIEEDTQGNITTQHADTAATAPRAAHTPQPGATAPADTAPIEVTPQPAETNVTVNVTVNGQEVAVTQEPTPVTPVEPEVEVHNIGSIMDSEGNIINHATVTIDGIDMVMVDADGDHTVDYALVDLNNDGQISADEVLDIQDAEITMQDIAQTMEDQQLDTMPDFDPEY